MKAYVGVRVNAIAVMLFLGTLAPAACGGSGGSDGVPSGLEITTDRARYRAGHSLMLTIRNRGADTVSFNPCTRTLEAQHEEKWLSVPEPARICTMEAWMLVPGGTRAGPTDLPADLAAGRYRVVLAFTAKSARPAAGQLEARTPSFTVER